MSLPHRHPRRQVPVQWVLFGLAFENVNVRLVVTVYKKCTEMVIVCVCEQEAAKATVWTAAPVCRAKTALNCAAVCLSTWAPRARLTNVTTVGTANVSPVMVFHLQGNSNAGERTNTRTVDKIYRHMWPSCTKGGFVSFSLPVPLWFYFLSSVAAQTAESSPAVTRVIRMSTVQMASAL